MGDGRQDWYDGGDGDVLEERIERRRTGIETVTGAFVVFDDPDAVPLREADLRYHLGEQRYHHAVDVTVLQHSALCVMLSLDRGYDERLVALCAVHDWQEAYLRDLASPLKVLLPDYRALESRWESSIRRRLGLWQVSRRDEDAVALVDRRALVAEMTVAGHPGLSRVETECGGPAAEVELDLARRALRMTEEAWAVVAGAVLDGASLAATGVEWDPRWEGVPVLGIAGPAGSGKDTVARMVIELVPAARLVALADPMKDFCREVFGWDEGRLRGPSERRAEADPDGLTARVALQRLGTEWGRALREDVWVDYALRRLEPCRLTVVTDVRFPNEARRIVEAGGSVLLVTGRAGAGVPAHESEAHWSDPELLRYCTYRVDNSGSLERTRKQVERIIREVSDALR